MALVCSLDPFRQDSWLRWEVTKKMPGPRKAHVCPYRRRPVCLGGLPPALKVGRGSALHLYDCWQEWAWERVCPRETGTLVFLPVFAAF